MSNIKELSANWKKLAGEPKKQEFYIEVNGELYKVTEITVKDSKEDFE